MASKPLNFASASYDRLQALASGKVKPEGIDLNFIDIDNPREIFDRLVTDKEFDAAEFSASEYIVNHTAGDRNLIALPAFVSRSFRHGFIVVDTNKIKSPKDLEGKRIGVQVYTMTAAIYIRGLLQHEYNVDLSTITWIEGSFSHPGPHGKPSSLATPSSATIIPNTDPQNSISDLFLSGSIDATIGASMPSCSAPHIQRLFPSYKPLEKSYYSQTQIFPIMHLIVLRSDFASWAARPLYAALQRSKDLAIKRMNFTAAPRYMLPWLAEALEETKEVFGGEGGWPYGVEENRETLKALVQYMFEQGLIERVPDLAELFADVSN